MYFEIIDDIENIETVAVGGRIRDIMKHNNKNILFVLCIENKDCDDLEKRKVYQVLPDDKAADEGYLRIVDESGEDYLYPESYFISVKLPRKVQEALRIPG